MIKDKKLRVVFAFLVIILALGAIVFIAYKTADRTVPDYKITLEGETLAYESADWNIPILGGLFYTPYKVFLQYDMTQTYFTKNDLLLDLPDLPGDYHCKVTDQDYNVVVEESLQPASSILLRFPKKGDYSVVVTVQVPKLNGQGYGSLVYFLPISLD